MRNIKIALFIAAKSILRGSKGTLILMVFILSLSYLNMLFISGILFGLQNLINTAVITNMSADITVSPQQIPQLKQFIPNQNEVRAKIASLPGVQATVRRYKLAGSISFDKEKTGIPKSIAGAIIGIDPSEDKKIFTTIRTFVEGSPLSENDRDQIILSSALAGGLGMPAPDDLGGARVGDKLQVTYSNGVMRTYTVKGIYLDSIGIYFNFISAKEAESVLSVYNNASQIFVKTDMTRGSVEKQAGKISKLLPMLKIQTYKALLGSFASFISTLNLISGIVSAISILVAAVTIFVLIYVNAINKRRQIGILKAIGIKQNIIILSYVFQALFYTVLGVAVGSFFVFLILTPLLERYPIYVDFGYLSLVHKASEVGLGTLSLIGAGLLAGYVPARIVAKQDILKAIWG